MSTALEIALAFGTFLSLVLHWYGKKHPTAETIADKVDQAETFAQGLKK